VLLQHHNSDPGASQQKAEHHAGGAAAEDAAIGLGVRIQARVNCLFLVDGSVEQFG